MEKIGEKKYYSMDDYERIGMSPENFATLKEMCKTKPGDAIWITDRNEVYIISSKVLDVKGEDYLTGNYVPLVPFDEVKDYLEKAGLMLCEELLEKSSKKIVTLLTPEEKVVKAFVVTSETEEQTYLEILKFGTEWYEKANAVEVKKELDWGLIITVILLLALAAYFGSILF